MTRPILGELLRAHTDDGFVDELLRLQGLVGRRVELAEELRAEQERHAAESARILGLMKANRAECSHPAMERRGNAFDGFYKDCPVCGHVTTEDRLA
jgi:hypothetical protein